MPKAPVSLPTDIPEHTRLSASGAERWMECPASIQIAERLGLEGEETDEGAEGTAAHELASHCLETETDAWEHFGKTFYEHEVNADMVVAVQVYLDECRYFTDKYPDCEPMIETRVDNKDLHPDFGGTADWSLVVPKILFVKDYKHGIGISKSAVKNAQLRYYGYGVYIKLTPEQQAKIEQIVLSIVQPRDFSPLGAVRTEIITPEELADWAENELFPAMEKVDTTDEPELQSGEYCRYCPAKIGCPTMTAMYNAAALADASEARILTNEELGLEYECIDQVKMYLKALQLEAYNRALKGRKIPGGKLVEGRVDRILTAGGEKKAKQKFGDDAYAERKLKSPAQIEKTVVGGAAFVAEYGYKPKKGKLSFVPTSHQSPAITVKSAAEKFKGIKE